MRYLAQIKMAVFCFLILQMSCGQKNTKEISSKPNTPAYSNNDCSFEQEQSKFLAKNAVNDATKSFNQSRYHFFAIAGGIGPRFPGLKSVPMSVCMVDNVEYYFLRVGNYPASCSSNIDLEPKAAEFAKLFNKQMISLLQTQENTFKCINDINKAY